MIGSATAEDGEYNDNRKGATGTINGLLAYGFQTGKDFELDAEADEDTFLAGDLIFQNIEVVVPDGDSYCHYLMQTSRRYFKKPPQKLKIFLVKLLQRFNDATSATVGADMSKFDGQWQK